MPQWDKDKGATDGQTERTYKLWVEFLNQLKVFVFTAQASLQQNIDLLERGIVRVMEKDQRKKKKRKKSGQITASQESCKFDVRGGGEGRLEQ